MERKWKNRNWWRLFVSGPLCAGMGGKKKKKMMYLTTKNAGKNLRIPIKHFSFKPFNFELFFSSAGGYKSCRVRSARVADLWGSGQSSALQEEDAGSDRSAGRGPPESEEQAAGVGSAALWDHRSLWVQRFRNFYAYMASFDQIWEILFHKKRFWFLIRSFFKQSRKMITSILEELNLAKV